MKLSRNNVIISPIETHQESLFQQFSQLLSESEPDEATLFIADIIKESRKIQMMGFRIDLPKWLIELPPPAYLIDPCQYAKPDYQMRMIQTGLAIEGVLLVDMLTIEQMLKKFDSLFLILNPVLAWYYAKHRKNNLDPMAAQNIIYKDYTASEVMKVLHEQLQDKITENTTVQQELNKMHDKGEDNLKLVDASQELADALALDWSKVPNQDRLSLLDYLRKLGIKRFELTKDEAQPLLIRAIRNGKAGALRLLLMVRGISLKAGEAVE